jgi:hypothetical protein
MDTVVTPAPAGSDKELIWRHPSGGEVKLIESSMPRRPCSWAYDAFYNGTCIGQIAYLGKSQKGNFRKGALLWTATRDYQDWCDITDVPDLMRDYIFNTPPVC